jgi:hypothetical protein
MRSTQDNGACGSAVGQAEDPPERACRGTGPEVGDCSRTHPGLAQGDVVGGFSDSRAVAVRPVPILLDVDQKFGGARLTRSRLNRT